MPLKSHLIVPIYSKFASKGNLACDVGTRGFKVGVVFGMLNCCYLADCFWYLLYVFSCSNYSERPTHTYSDFTWLPLASRSNVILTGVALLSLT